MISRQRLRKIILETIQESEVNEAESSTSLHHYPTFDWTEKVDDLVDAWVEMELKTFDEADPSMMGNAETKKEAQEFWEEQVFEAAKMLEQRMQQELKRVIPQLMDEIDRQLIDGQFAR